MRSNHQDQSPASSRQGPATSGVGGSCYAMRGLLSSHDGGGSYHGFMSTSSFLSAGISVSRRRISMAKNAYYSKR